MVRRLLPRGQGHSFEVIEIVYTIIVMVAIQLYTTGKTHEVVHFRLVKYILYKSLVGQLIKNLPPR